MADPVAPDFCVPCKIILDQGGALKTAVECMQHSVHLGQSAGLTPPAAMVAKVRVAFEAAAMAAQELARWYPQ